MKLTSKRRWWAAGVATVGVVAVAVPVATVLAEEPTAAGESNGECEINPLSDKGGLMTSVSGSGEYVAGTADGDPTVWRDGEPVDIDWDQLDFTDNLVVYDVNSDGAVVGTSENNRGDTQGWIYRDGEFTVLTIPEEYSDSFRAIGINDAGQLIGETWKDSEEEPEIPLKWEAGETAAEALPLQDGFYGQVNDLDEDGNIVGHQFDSTGTDDSLVPWLWDSEGTDNKLSGTEDERYTLISVGSEFALSDAGEGGTQYYWDLTADGPFEVEGLDSAVAIRSDQSVFGMIDDATPGFVDADGAHELETLGAEPGDDRPEPHEVVGASESGDVIVGTSTDENDNQRPVMWTCA